jgi:hypothetical protein
MISSQPLNETKGRIHCSPSRVQNLLTHLQPISIHIRSRKRSSFRFIFRSVTAARLLSLRAAMLHRLFSAATSAAALKGKSLAVEEEETAKSKKLLFGYILGYC